MARKEQADDTLDSSNGVLASRLNSLALMSDFRQRLPSGFSIFEVPAPTCPARCNCLNAYWSRSKPLFIRFIYYFTVVCSKCQIFFRAFGEEKTFPLIRLALFETSLAAPFIARLKVLC